LIRLEYAVTQKWNDGCHGNSLFAAVLLDER
jgi:hypothetical protein